jgi:hypothetical protein
MEKEGASSDRLLAPNPKIITHRLALASTHDNISSSWVSSLYILFVNPEIFYATFVQYV